MAEQIGKANKWRDLYRLVILKEETLQEVNSYKLTLLNIYIWVSSLLIILSILIVAAIFYTPLKKLVPGYGDPSEDPAYMALYAKVDDMGKQLEAYEIYTSNFRKMVMGNDSLQKASKSIAPRLDDQSIGQNIDALEQIIAQRNFEGMSSSEQENQSMSPRRNDSMQQVVFQSPSANALDQLFLQAPLSGPISSGFDAEVDHFGVDILAPKDTPVKAILDGHVVTSDWTLEAGNTIGIQHSNNVFSFYKHNAVLLKKPGSFVHAGEAIAIVGNTGKFTTGPHLHFELWQNGLPVDPELYIDFK